MARLLPQYSGLHTLTITMQTPQETLQGTPTTLPTSEPSPGNEQISYTMASGDLPAFSIPMLSQVWVPVVVGAGKVVTAATISWRIKKNGTSVATGSSAVAAGYYYTATGYFYSANVGDVLTMSLWSNQTDSNWDYNGYQVAFTRLIPDKLNLYSLSFSSLTTLTPFTQGNPINDGNNNPYFYVSSVPYAVQFSSAMSFTFIQLNSTYGLMRLYLGDYGTSNSVSLLTDATHHPANYRNNVPLTITYRYLRLP